MVEFVVLKAMSMTMEFAKMPAHLKGQSLSKEFAANVDYPKFQLVAFAVLKVK